MATVNFSVPDDVKDSFNETFGRENKSAIIAGLMKRAVEERRRERRRAAAIDAIVELRQRQAPVTDEAIHRSRRELR